MPIHDWTRVDAGIFHHFHHEWIAELANSLNGGLLGSSYYALAEQVAFGRNPDVLTLQVPVGGIARDKPGVGSLPNGGAGGVALSVRPPKARFHIESVPQWYAATKKSVAIRHVSGHRVIAVVEIVSPGNKASQSALCAFVRKVHDLLAAGIHVSIVDLFPPTPRDPHGLHPVVWGDDDACPLDPEKPLTCASYVGGPAMQAFVEPVRVGDRLPDLSIFLTVDQYVEVPLEATYLASFDSLPEFWRNVMQDGQDLLPPIA
jgi:hypothetical protein